MTEAIRLNNVCKTFGATKAVTDLDLVIPRGALYGFIGPNGAGKTTTIRMMMSILFPDTGELSILGHKSALDAKHQATNSAVLRARRWSQLSGVRRLHASPALNSSAA